MFQFSPAYVSYLRQRIASHPFSAFVKVEAKPGVTWFLACERGIINPANPMHVIPWWAFHAQKAAAPNKEEPKEPPKLSMVAYRSYRCPTVFNHCPCCNAGPDYIRWGTVETVAGTRTLFDCRNCKSKLRPRGEF